MDAESHVDAFASKQRDHLSDWVLCLGDAQTVTGGDDDVLGSGDHLSSFIYVSLSVSTGDLHGFAGTCGGGTVTTEDDIWQRSVHGLQTREV